MRPFPASSLAIATILVAGILASAAGSARAASFDCKKAKTQIEKSVCADSELSALDDKLAAVYRATLAKLSPEGQRLLQNGQGQWLRALRTDCDVKGAVRLCIETAYNDRLRQIDSGVVRIAGFLFMNVDLFRSEFCTGGNGETYIFKERVSYPRIDSPRTEATARWNAQRKDSLNKEHRCDPESNSDYYSRYDIDVVGGPIVTITFSGFDCCDTLINGYSWENRETFDLSRSLEPLTGDNFFVPDSGWVTFLIQRSMEALKEQNGSVSLDPELLRGLVDDSQHWAIQKSGLSIHFLPYTIGGYAFELTIPWADLKPYLRSDAPIPR